MGRPKGAAPAEKKRTKKERAVPCRFVETKQCKVLVLGIAVLLAAVPLAFLNVDAVVYVPAQQIACLDDGTNEIDHVPAASLEDWEIELELCAWYDSLTENCGDSRVTPVTLERDALQCSELPSANLDVEKTIVSDWSVVSGGTLVLSDAMHVINRFRQRSSSMNTCDRLVTLAGSLL